MNASVNLANLHEMTDGDTQMEHELFQVFLESSEECLAHLRTSCNQGAEQEWRHHVHAWKGISFNLGAEHLGQLCKQAQDNCVAPIEEKLRMLADLQKEYEQVRLFLQNQ
jgi:HPt (histidine-containing phosphotransfer) domain-containing protein